MSDDSSFAPHDQLQNHQGSWIRREAVEARLAELTAEIEKLRTPAPTPSETA